MPLALRPDLTRDPRAPLTLPVPPMNYWQIADDPSRTAPAEHFAAEHADAAKADRERLIAVKRIELRCAIHHDLYAVIQASHLDLSGYARELIVDSTLEDVATMLTDRQMTGFNVRFERRHRV